MGANLADAYLSAIDEERFGIKTARASRISYDSLPALLEFCRTNQVVLLIARCPVEELRAAQAMEACGFFLTDTLIYYMRDLCRAEIPFDACKYVIRPLRTHEEEQVRCVAALSFRGYAGHYHADQRLDRDRCDEAYQSWATLSCVSRNVADEVLVAVREEEIVAFATLRKNNSEEAEGVLFGVAPSAQGQGIYRSLIIQGLYWARSWGARRMCVSTQVTNIAVQKVWVRVGFEPNQMYYTFHKWFDERIG